MRRYDPDTANPRRQRALIDFGVPLAQHKLRQEQSWEEAGGGGWWMVATREVFLRVKRLRHCFVIPHSIATSVQKNGTPFLLGAGARAVRGGGAGWPARPRLPVAPAERLRPQRLQRVADRRARDRRRVPRASDTRCFCMPAQWGVGAATCAMRPTPSVMFTPDSR